jgi:allophanate hydrolase
VDALLLPVTPTHPTLAEVAADPVGVNARLGRFTNFVNLLDLAAVAVPADRRADGLPFGVQFIGPAFADDPLLDLAARWCGEPAAEPAVPPGHTLVTVAADAAVRSRLAGAGALRSRGRAADGAPTEVWQVPAGSAAADLTGPAGGSGG